MNGLDIPVWYQTKQEAADALRCSVDRVAYACDAGLLVPAALVPKAMLPFDCPGPAPHIVVVLDAYRSMQWMPTDDGDMVAPLVGEYQAYEIDRDAFRSFTLADADSVYVSRRSLVIPTRQVDDLTGQRSTLRRDERRTLLLLLGSVLVDQYGDDALKHYVVGNGIAAQLWSRGVEMSERTAAEKVCEAVALYRESCAEVV